MKFFGNGADTFPEKQKGRYVEERHFILPLSYLIFFNETENTKNTNTHIGNIVAVL